MTAKGHVLLSLPFGIIEAHHLGLDHFSSGLFILAVGVGSLFPDIDEPGSYIGRRFWFLSWAVKLLSFFFPSFKHRGVTHLFVVPLALIVVGILLKNIWIAGFALGWLLHTVGDLLTVGGIFGYLYPIWRDKKIALLPYRFRFYTGGFAESMVNGVLLVVNAYLLIEYQGVL